VLDHEGGDRERENGSRDVVERRLGDDRLPDLRPDAQALEERDQDGGIGGGEDGPDQEAYSERDVEGEGGDGARGERRDDDARDREQPEPEGDGSEDAHEEAEAAVEEDERDAECEEELNADGLEREVEHVQHLGAEKHACTERATMRGSGRGRRRARRRPPPRGGAPGSR
jgi:hypothetical protein